MEPAAANIRFVTGESFPPALWVGGPRPTRTGDFLNEEPRAAHLFVVPTPPGILRR